MIRYTLKCSGGHTFESWFPSSDSYEAQRQRGLVSCPECGSVKVDKAVMAPAVARTDTRPAPQEAPRESSAPVALMSETTQELRELLRQVRDHVVRNSDYVGDDFADLARKMHDGEIEHRSIYGEATADEVKALREEEVEVFPLPILPEDRN